VTIAIMPSRARHPGLSEAVRAEGIKLATLRSTSWTVAITVVGSIAITVLSTNSVSHQGRSYQGFDPTNQALGGLLLAALTFGIVGALVATSEYGSGTIRSSLTAVPSRPTFLAAKVIVLGVLAAVAGEALSFMCFWVGQAVLAGAGAPTASLAQGAVLRAVLLAGLSLAMLALTGLGLGLLLRHSAGGLAAYAGLTFLLPFALQRIPSDPARFTPIPIVANSLAAVVHDSDAVSLLLGVGLMVLYCVVSLAVGAARLLRRDA
jgi:ABC-2 type transport system permease protein